MQGESRPLLARSRSGTPSLPSVSTASWWDRLGLLLPGATMHSLIGVGGFDPLQIDYDFGEDDDMDDEKDSYAVIDSSKEVGAVPAGINFALASGVGASVLSAPGLFGLSGLLGGLIILFVMGFIASITNIQMCIASFLSHQFTPRNCVKQGFPLVVQKAFDIILTCYCALFLTAFLIIIRGGLEDILKIWFNSRDHIFMTSWGLNLAILLFMSPMLLFASVEMLAKTSPLGLLMILYTLIMLIVRGVTQGDFGSLPLFGSVQGTVKGVLICVNMFAVHLSVSSYFKILKRRTVKQAGKFVRIGCLLIAVLVGSGGVGGFAIFGEEVQGNVLSGFDAKDIWAIIARAGIALSLIFSFCLLMFPTVQSMKSIVPGALGNNDKVLVVFAVILTYAVSLLLDDLQSLLAFMGSTIGVFTGYWMPAVLLWRFSGTVAKRDKTVRNARYISLFTALLGLVFSGVGIYSLYFA